VALQTGGLADRISQAAVVKADIDWIVANLNAFWLSVSSEFRLGERGLHGTINIVAGNICFGHSSESHR